PRDDVWRSGCRIERRRTLTFLGDVKICCAIWVFWVLKFLGEIKASHPDRLDVAKPWECGRRQRPRERGKLPLRLRRIRGCDDGGERPVGIILTPLPGIDTLGHEERGHADRRPIDDEFHT